MSAVESITSRSVAARRIGYVRLTSLDSDEALQNAGMKKMNCYCVFQDVTERARKKRQGLASVLDVLTINDVLVVWRLDHLDMTTQQFILLLDKFKSQGIHLISINDGIDTTAVNGGSMLHIGAALAQMERRVISERHIERFLVTEKRRGRPTILSETILKTIEQLAAQPALSTADVAKQVGVSRATVYRARSLLRARSRLLSETGHDVPPGRIGNYAQIGGKPDVVDSARCDR